LHLQFQLHGDLTQREITREDQRRDPAVLAAFQYRKISPPNGAQAFPSPGSLAWLDVVSETVRGQMIKTRVTHALSLLPEGPDGTLAWRVATTIEASPRWNDADHLAIQMPAGCEYLEDRAAPLPDKVRAVEYDRTSRTVRFKLIRTLGESATKPFLVMVEGHYARPAQRSGRVALALPRPVGSVDQGGQVTLRVPQDVELSQEVDNPALDLGRATLHDQTWRFRRLPESIEMAWQPYRAEIQATSVADVTLSAGQGQVTHEVRLQFGQTPPAQIALRVPTALADSFTVVEGGKLISRDESTPRDVYPIKLTDATGPNQRLLLRYTFALAKGASSIRSGEAFAVPLAAPEQVTQGDLKVRIWSEPGSLPVPVSNGWTEQNIEEVKDHKHLPVLVLQARRLDMPLTLRYSAATEVFTVLAEQAVIQATLAEGGGQSYQASFLLRHLAARRLDVEFPASIPLLNLHIFLDSKEVDPEIVDETGQRSDGGRIARLRLSPDLVDKPAVLEASYQLPPGRTGNGMLHTLLQPPVLHGDPGYIPTRWQVTLMSNGTIIWPEAGPGSERWWSWRGWLLAPRTMLSDTELERRCIEGSPSLAGREGDTPWVCRRGGLEPLVLLHLSQQTWLLICSLGLLVVGLCLYGLARPANHRGPTVWLWPALALLTLIGVVAGVLWPTVLAQVAYGCEPGAAVLLLVGLLQWLVHERYRRQIVFLPSFSRGRAGSSLLRGSSAQRLAHGEPSTVDSPPAIGSSLGKVEGERQKAD
jgi:hypothetical protein